MRQSAHRLAWRPRACPAVFQTLVYLAPLPLVTANNVLSAENAIPQGCLASRCGSTSRRRTMSRKTPVPSGPIVRHQRLSGEMSPIWYSRSGYIARRQVSNRAPLVKSQTCMRSEPFSKVTSFVPSSKNRQGISDFVGRRWWTAPRCKSHTSTVSSFRRIASQWQSGEMTASPRRTLRPQQTQNPPGQNRALSSASLLLVH